MYEPINNFFEFIVPLIERWSKTDLPESEQQERVAAFSALYSWLTLQTGKRREYGKHGFFKLNGLKIDESGQIWVAMNIGKTGKKEWLQRLTVSDCSIIEHFFKCNAHL